MKRPLYRTLSGLVSLAVVFFVLAGASLWYLDSDAVRGSVATVSEWKKSEWLRNKNFPLLAKAVASAEDPSFLWQPKLDCGLSTFISSANLTGCSPIIFIAARLASAGTYVTQFRAHVVTAFVASDLSERPDEALDVILNKIFLGFKSDDTPIEGFQQAAQFYFKLKPDDLNISQAALLAGMIQAPMRYLPTKNPELAKDRRDHVIDQMVQSSFITEADGLAAKQEPIQFSNQ